MTLIAVHSGKPKPGKIAEAHEAAQTVMRYLNEHYAERDIQIWTSVDGPYRIHFVSRHESWADRENSVAKLGQDKEFQEIAAKSWEVFEVEDAEWHFYTVSE